VISRETRFRFRARPGASPLPYVTDVPWGRNPGALSAATYASEFDLTESPISERGVGRRLGSDWTQGDGWRGSPLAPRRGKAATTTRLLTYDDSFAYGVDQVASGVICLEILRSPALARRRLVRTLPVHLSRRSALGIFSLSRS
jgi:hypothetical protein